MICQDCGKEFFDEQHPRRKFCDECTYEHKRKNWAKHNATRKKTPLSIPEEQFKGKTPEEIVIAKLNLISNGRPLKPFCMHCGREFEPKYPGEKYCSPECYSNSPLRKFFWNSLPACYQELIDLC